MSTVGFGLLKSLIENFVPFSVLTESGIDEDYFIASERRAYVFVSDYFMSFGDYPQIDTIRAEIERADCFSNLPSEPPEYWIKKVQDRWRFNRIQATKKAVDDLLSADKTEEAIALLGEAYSLLRGSYKETRIMDLSELQRKVLDKHDELQKNPRQMSGVPFGFPYLDGVSGGAQKGDSIVIVGQTGVGKTYLTLKVSLAAHEAGANVLFLCTEMPAEQVARRLLAMQVGLSTQHLKLGRLSYFAVRKARGYLDERESNSYYWVLPGGLYARIDDLGLVVREHNPDLLCVDGAYLLRIPNWRGVARWEKAMEIMERIKSMSMVEEIPTVATYQYNKEAPGTLEGIAGTIAISQLASIVLSFEFERKEDRNSTNPVQFRILKLLKGRDGETGTLRLLYDMQRSKIEQDRVLVGYSEDPSEEGEIVPVEVDSDPFEEI
jgi:replicative DNA helicase